MALRHAEAITKTLRAGPPILRQLLHGVSTADARYRPTPNSWAIVEVIAHMADVDARSQARLRRMLDEAHPFLPAFDQDALAREERYIERDLEQELLRYEQSRAAHVASLATLDSTAWSRTGQHASFGRLTVELYETLIAGEDMDHLAQIARLIVDAQRQTAMDTAK